MSCEISLHLLLLLFFAYDGIVLKFDVLFLNILKMLCCKFSLNIPVISFEQFLPVNVCCYWNLMEIFMTIAVTVQQWSTVSLQSLLVLLMAGWHDSGKYGYSDSHVRVIKMLNIFRNY